MKHLTSLLLALSFPLGLFAQTSAEDEIRANRALSASNYLAYVDPTEGLTPAPKGYEPFYLTHYGRHGSRWLINKADYDEALHCLRRAKEADALTPFGLSVLERLERHYQTTTKRLVELTSVGERQHHGIVRRMAERFPEIFAQRNTQVDARSTVVIRCILSMEAACEELAAANPKARIHNDVSESFQWYLNADWTERTRKDNKARWAQVADLTQRYVHPERMWGELFADTAYRDRKVSPQSLMKRLFQICSNMQSHDSDISFYDLFTDEELFDLWRMKNIDWYVNYAQGTAPYTQANLLDNIIATADTIINSRDFHGATLRYGHEVCVMPLACLLEMGNTYPDIDAQGLDTLHLAWQNYRIFPMASNIQLVFYRPKRGEGDILVKAMLNEREVSLPATPVEGPYYRWADLRAYYTAKLEAYGRRD